MAGGDADKSTLSPDSQDFFEGRSTKSTLCGVSRSRAIKHIFDSEYVKPDENYRVFKESHPKRSAVLKDALDRYEAQLQNDKEAHENNMYIHRMRIEHDENELQREKDLKAYKQNHFKQAML